MFVFCFTDFFCDFIVQELDIDGELPKKLSNYQGVYYNYFSIGMMINRS